MMKQELMTIMEHSTVAKDTYMLVIQGESVAPPIDPGQFVHVLVSRDFFLRRPLSIADVNFANGTLTLLYKELGKGTQALSLKQVGETLDVLGPGGQGFPVESLNIEKALLVGGGIGVPPLYYLAKQLTDKGVAVESVLGFQTKEDVFYEEHFRALGEVRVMTNDGSRGDKGFVTDGLPEGEEAFDMYFSCGPAVMLKAVSDQLASYPGYISIEERMGCGIGACFACVVPADSGKGYKKICRDGPVFRPEEVIL
ncbi:dihydroorotate dehydrogenase electron transfer subunit [Thalassobacillus sp. CUG 92003]|uniref:dihydroorotate dehydrogenase electron transfer subunit n=1 Tax=Thalassobacillus sp. CUG 92003 TaxID=2736641 RepID=UPI0015E6DE16|nr:dihydroorotate dehydrogenase electron transfer subunit [Thalassobacillus sp. CUG 92003]